MEKSNLVLEIVRVQNNEAQYITDNKLFETRIH